LGGDFEGGKEVFFLKKEAKTFSPPPLRVGKVVLNVHDLERVSRFYREAVGLHAIAQDVTSAKLGVGDSVLLELRSEPAAQRHAAHEAGLFHTAFLLPSRSQLGSWLKHAAGLRLTLQGSADHLVSEAIYLADPEGNGIEIYADRPRELWTWHDGVVAMSNERLDLQGLMADAEPWQNAPAGSTIGHVHLQVGAIPEAEAFYAGLLGFDVTCRYRGGSFFGSGGYHHHLATNIWNSRGAPVRSNPTTGLADVEIIASDSAVLEAIHARVSAYQPLVETSAGFSVRDPWGTSFTLTS